MDIRIKRAYDEPAKNDGFRVLVDRIWPRGVKKEDARLDVWMREIAPSDELRKWFNHDPVKWLEFVEKYFRELEGHGELVAKLLRRGRNRRLTLVFGAKDRDKNNAIALKQFLRRQEDKFWKEEE
jgi:uncharacterized protein YeaO (DUF488 family)